jgi:uncharacterized integral membrane protein
MRLRSVFIIVATLLLTIVILQNNQSVTFTFLIVRVRVPKLVVLTGVSVISFLLGIIAGRPKRYDVQMREHDDHDGSGTHPNTLSDEDREYIS